MRKGIVMEQNNNYMIVMTNDGQFHRAERLENAEVGMEVQFTALAEKRFFFGKMVRDNRMKMAVAALIFLLAAFPIFSWYGSNQAYAYVNLDINPSVKMELNDHMEVISIIPQNEDAEKLIPLLSKWKKKDASEVTLQLIQLSQEQGLVNEKNQVLIGVSYVKSGGPGDLSNQLESYLSTEELDLAIATFDIPDRIRQEAEKTGASANKLYAENMDQSTDAEQVPKEDDRAIIQSFYNEDSSGNIADQSTTENPSSETSESESRDNIEEQKPAKLPSNADNQWIHKSGDTKPDIKLEKSKSEEWKDNSNREKKNQSESSSKDKEDTREKGEKKKSNKNHKQNDSKKNKEKSKPKNNDEDKGKGKSKEKNKHNRDKQHDKDKSRTGKDKKGEGKEKGHEKGNKGNNH
ncbi:anti-sigma factor domain-containing protein [Halobacillus salinus]|uniref:anti-sigma factor domain-containing protein n=1 Tax=Halobacillus salinus TaxID=192814 RepID=UPI0009A8F34A|nr:anti-sigma factor domain-containing protein [Halobacillus salinus]